MVARFRAKIIQTRSKEGRGRGGGLALADWELSIEHVVCGRFGGKHDSRWGGHGLYLGVDRLSGSASGWQVCLGTRLDSPTPPPAPLPHSPTPPPAPPDTKIARAWLSTYRDTSSKGLASAALAGRKAPTLLLPPPPPPSPSSSSAGRTSALARSAGPRGHLRLRLRRVDASGDLGNGREPSCRTKPGDTTRINSTGLGLGAGGAATRRWRRMSSIRMKPQPKQIRAAMSEVTEPASSWA
eukprot:scaffold20823_cov91-Isochrysis_galbana.AAC.1